MQSLALSLQQPAWITRCPERAPGDKPHQPEGWAKIILARKSKKKTWANRLPESNESR